MKSFDVYKYQEIISKLGLNEKEALIYLSAIELGGGSISELAQTADIERTGVYYYIQKLVDQKLLKPIEQGKRTVYLPSDPSRLRKIIESNQKEFEKIFPALDERFSQGASKSIIEYYEGIEEVDKFYDRVYSLLQTYTEPENTIYVLGNSYRIATETHSIFKKFQPPEEKINIITKAVLPKSQKSHDSAENAMDPYIVTRYNLPEAKIKYISDKYQYPGSVVIMHDKIALYDFRNLIFSITENKNLATTWRMFFEFIWDNLK